MEQKLGDINLIWRISRRERIPKSVLCSVFQKANIFFILNFSAYSEKKNSEEKKACDALYLSIYINKKIDRYPYYIHTLFIDIDQKYINLPQGDSNQVAETPKAVT